MINAKPARALAAALALASAGLAAQAEARQDISRAAAKAMPRLQSSMNGNDCDGALKIISPLVARKDFGTLEPLLQGPILLSATICEGQANKLDAALGHARMLTALPGAADIAWRLRYAVELDSKRDGDAVTTLEMIQKQAPSAFGSIPDDWIFALVNRLDDRQDDPAYRRLLVLATAPAFPPAINDAGFARLRLPLARLLAREGDKESAAAQVAAIREADLLRQASLDPHLRSYLPADFDLRAAYERQAADLEQRSIARPGRLALPIDLAATQRVLGQADKALATLQAARPDGVLAKQFSDRDERVNWWWDGLARTYEQLGRYGEAVEAYRTAIAGGEKGRPNVSQTINLAYLHVRFGHPREALALLAPFAQQAGAAASPYGVMEMRLAHACAAQALALDDLAATDLAYAQAHPEDHPEALTDMQMCMGRFDDAAASMIARLGDPDRQVDALGQLSEYRPLPAGVPPGLFDAGLTALRARADVQAAIARAGGTRKFDVLPATL
ncbi:tetratricopeptide repeat protein [Novosphingobium clariflavum]|uniref:Tetratricopeptide repeat protein n=1 Tax=Novosphingobium clariflavum TaxID=2029884 RepID=A0ABV6SEQ3_9SPHN|nr:tetratricopeptide repeat protein [Novosphingobium clariflavum]